MVESEVEWLFWREPISNGEVDFITSELPLVARSQGRDWGIYIGMCSTGRDGSSVVWRTDVDIIWSVEQD
jgi:hypothetical protein